MPEYKFSIQPDISAGYLTMQEGEFGRTGQVNPEVFIDYDTSGALMGIEFLSLESIEKFNPDEISSAVKPQELAELKMLLGSHLDVKSVVLESRNQKITEFTEILISI